MDPTATFPPSLVRQLPSSAARVENNQNLAWADYLRVFATCGVVFLHYAAPGLLFATSTLNYWVGNLSDSAVRACVPLFVMLTGALVLPSERELSDYLKRRMGRILLPALFWSAIYLGYNYYLKKQAGELPSALATVKWAYGSFQLGTQFHLWYVYMIVGIYLFIPIIGRWIRAAPEKEIRYFLAIWAVTLFSSFPLLAKYGIAVELRYFGGYLGYLVLGYYLSQSRFATQNWTRTAIASSFLGFVITVAGTYCLTLKNHAFSELFYTYLTPNVALMAAGIFYLIKRAVWPEISGGLKFIARNSYNIYLGHILIFLLLAKNGVQGYMINPLLGVPLLTLLNLALTSILAWLISKSFLGKHIGG